MFEIIVHPTAVEILSGRHVPTEQSSVSEKGVLRLFAQGSGLV